jgi:hypothetical protein
LWRGRRERGLAALDFELRNAGGFVPRGAGRFDRQQGLGDVGADLGDDVAEVELDFVSEVEVDFDCVGRGNVAHVCSVPLGLVCGEYACAAARAREELFPQAPRRASAAALIVLTSCYFVSASAAM